VPAERRPKRIVERAVVGATVEKSTMPNATAKTKSDAGSRANTRYTSVTARPA
jgi:hypothetical protein